MFINFSAGSMTINPPPQQPITPAAQKWRSKSLQVVEDTSEEEAGTLKVYHPTC